MRLRYAYNTNGAANHRLDDALNLIADAGYDGVALTLDIHHLDPFAEGWERETERVRGLLDGHGLGSVIETGARFLLDPTDKHEPTLLTATAEGRARRVAFLVRALEIAARLESETMSFWAGVPKPGIASENAFAWLHDGLERVLDAAERLDVPASLEPEPGMLVETVADYAALAERHPRLRLALDTGHCLVTRDVEPVDAVHAFADRIGTIAIEDMALGDHTHLPFGTGDMDVPGVLAAIGEVEFTGLVCVELSRESPRAHHAIPESIGFLKAAEG